MKKFLALAVIVLSVAAIAAAQTPSIGASVYSLNYYSNRNNSAGADQVTRIINPGTVGTPISADEGTLCADLYVFDSTQEMLECCGCKVTANGILQLSILKDLMQDPLTGFPAPNSGVIKLVSAVAGKTCDPTAPVPVPTLLAWQTHVQQPTSGTFVTTEDAFQPAPLNLVQDMPNDPRASELAFLAQTCSFVQYLGSGNGVCTCASAS